jgi:hypothetical protein
MRRLCESCGCKTSRLSRRQASGFDIVFDTVGGATLDVSFGLVKPYSGRVVSILGWGTHSLAPLSFRGASYSDVFTLLPLLTGAGRAPPGRGVPPGQGRHRAGLPCSIHQF